VPAGRPPGEGITARYGKLEVKNARLPICAAPWLWRRSSDGTPNWMFCVRSCAGPNGRHPDRSRGPPFGRAEMGRLVCAGARSVHGLHECTGDVAGHLRAEGGGVGAGGAEVEAGGERGVVQRLTGGAGGG